MSSPEPARVAARGALPLNGVALNAWSVIAAFGAYFCMYMFRKPFTAATFENLSVFGMAYKPVVIIAQVLGYTISKFIGIRVVSEASPSKRVAWYLGLILFAELALVLAGLTPSPVNLVWYFANGLPLGMVFGFVLTFLEGRTKTEMLTAGLCVSFVVADGFAKSCGLWVIEQGVSEAWMPAAVGGLFIPGILLFGWMLTKIPEPSEEDVQQRSKRSAMDKGDRKALFKRFAPGLILLAAVYSITGVLRGIRGDFSREIWQGLNYKVDAASFARSELIVAISVLVIVSMLTLAKDNRKAFALGLGLACSGFIIVMLGLVGVQTAAVAPFSFMVLVGFGLYLPYIAFHTTIFERLIAYTREKATIGYLMYLADASSYAALVGVLLYKTFRKAEPGDILPFFYGLSWLTAISCLLMIPPAYFYFKSRRTDSR
jgi:hypothetical protein